MCSHHVVDCIVKSSRACVASGWAWPVGGRGWREIHGGKGMSLGTLELGSKYSWVCQSCNENADGQDEEGDSEQHVHARRRFWEGHAQLVREEDSVEDEDSFDVRLHRHHNATHGESVRGFSLRARLAARLLTLTAGIHSLRWKSLCR